MPAPARHCAFAVLRRVFEDGAWADRALRGEAERLGLDARDLALATRLAYCAVQRPATPHHLIETLAPPPPPRAPPPPRPLYRAAPPPPARPPRRLRDRRPAPRHLPARPSRPGPRPRGGGGG